MAYTVKKLAEISGVSVRTLHWYDAKGLLKPAGHSAKGYRLYEEAQLLTLQQILFFRELGFELRQIQCILGRSDFDKRAALKSHREVLRKNLDRIRELIRTIDKTLDHMSGTKTMKSEEMFEGFDAEEQARHEKHLADRYGPEMKKSIAASKARVKHWTKAQWEKSGAAFDGICRGLVALLERRMPPGSPEVKEVIRGHFEWMKQFWTPDRDSYAGHAQLILDSELRRAYEKHHPELPEFTAAGIREFAKSELG